MTQETKVHEHQWAKIDQNRTKSYGLNDIVWVKWACPCGATRSTDHMVSHHSDDGCGP